MKGKGYKPHASEGKLPADTANIQKPAEYIQNLKEEEKKEENIDSAANSEIKTDNAGVTPAPEETEVSKDLDKQTPDVDKLTQDKNGIDPAVDAKAPEAKEEKKEEVKVTDVEKTKAENEGKLPADLANIQDPAKDIQDLKEETEKVIASEISDESVARDLATKNNAEAVQNPQTKLWKVVSKATNPATTGAYVASTPATEKKVNVCSKCNKEACECIKEEKVVECPTVDAAKNDKELSKLEKPKVKEDVDVTIKTDDKEVNIVSAEGSTQVTTQDIGTPAPVSTVTEPPVTTEAPISEPEPELELEEEPELSDEEALEMAEKLMVAEHLSKMDEKKMSAKQKKFVEDMKAKKFSKKNKEKVEQKKKEIK
jgi:hypothetical protein